ncbi:MAG: Gfo/Idh/MocA family protein [Acidobacteriota bacterium]
MSKTLKVGLIGAGYWGPNILRNLLQIPEVETTCVADLKEENREKIRRTYPSVRVLESHHEVLDDTGIDAVVVATPALTHSQLTAEALNAGKHVLVEKPLCESTERGIELIQMAAERDLTLMVGHTFLYNAAVRKARELIESSEIGDVLYAYGTRVNLGKVRQDVNSLWNFAPHDVSIVNYLLSETPTSVQAFGACYIQENIEDVVFLNLRYPDGIICSLHLGWLDPKKVRQITIVGTQKMIIYDDVSADQKIQVVDKGVEVRGRQDPPGEMVGFGEYQVLLRSGDIVIPKIDFEEPLRVECSHFVDCCLTGQPPLSDGVHGLQVVAVLEAATRSLKRSGSEERVEYPELQS